MLPNFLLIGAMKSGTTSLYRMLRQHPEVYLPEIKELHYFSYEKKWRLGIDWYESNFIGHRGETIIGEASASYTKNGDPDQVADRVAQTLPNASLIYILRNPVERMFSQYKHLLVTGLRRNFAQAIQEEDLLDVSSYFDKLMPYLKRLPQERIQVLFFDDLIKRPAETVASVFRFLGVDPGFEPQDMSRAYNVSKDKIKKANSEKGMDISPFLKDYGQLEGDLRQRVLERLQSNLQQISELTNRQLDDWDPERSLDLFFSGDRPSGGTQETEDADSPPKTRSIDIDQMISKIGNPAFRSRFLIEYRSVSEWVAKHLDLSNASVLDFGCGQGIAALRFALQHSQTQVHGIDVREGFNELQKQSRNQLGLEELPGNLHFATSVSDELPYDSEQFDLVYAWSVFEHVDLSKIDGVISELKRILKPSGLLFVQVEPLFFSARGAHLEPLLTEPWVHLRNSQEELKKMLFAATMEFGEKNPAREKTRLKNMQEYQWEQYKNLNRITGDQLIEVFSTIGLEVVREHRTREKIAPPEQLLKTHSEEVLTNNQILILFRKSG
jgi:2-polyprenyl-3-methyl-5-hydroxy-6-metoxy-1,4-benzoquinol methylase